MNTQTQSNRDAVMRAALKMAIEALEMAMEADWELNKSHVFNILHSITVCKEALAQDEKFCDGNCVWTDHHPNCKLAQPAQEPVAWYWNNNHRDKIPYAGVERGNPKMDVVYGTPIPLYTHPAPSWQGLSDKDFNEAHDIEFRRGAAWAEQILEEKNQAITLTS